MKYTRVVTHTDFDGVVSALLISVIHKIENIIFTEPWLIQQGEFHARKGDIVVDLPYADGCSLWFDHHTTSEKDAEKGILDSEAKSCARVIFNQYKDNQEIQRFTELVDATDKIDSASFTKEDLEHPDVYGKLSMALRGDDKKKDDQFRQFLINMLSFQTPEQVLTHSIVMKRVDEKIQQHDAWKTAIKEFVQIKGKVIFVDRTTSHDLPRDQPFWLYLMYPGNAVYLSIDNLKYEPDKVKISCGENIFEKINTVNIGELMKKYGGGGHKAAGGCSILKADKTRVLAELIGFLNQ